MAKRPADEPLEVVAYQDSPSSKKVRVGTERPSKQSNEARVAPVPSATGYTIGRNGDPSSSRTSAEDPDTSGDVPNGSSQAGLDEEDETAFATPARQSAPADGYNDLYLDTIDRSVLDFDFEKLCSVSLSNMNVYACLICGKYFQGRGPKSYAYFHALEVGHHVYVNMQTKSVYVLPEGYEVKSKSLDDIKFVVDPHLSKEEVIRLDKEGKVSRDLAGKKYQPGKRY